MPNGQTGDMQTRLVSVLRNAAERLGKTRLPTELATHMERLAQEVRQPCSVAVVGRVKAGKSSLINALLGEDLASVGATETTATINYFRYGSANPDRPITCHWRGGKTELVDRAFLESLQGHDEETLRRADGIDYLEYHLLNPFLEQITLIDTPGTGAAVLEHGVRTDEFMNLDRDLRARHDTETRRLGRDADAVVYVAGATATARDLGFLERFNETMGSESTALNAIGVLAKIDLQPDILARRDELATRVATQLRHSLNTVVPVSAGLRRALDRLLQNDAAGLDQIMTLFRAMPVQLVDKVLDDEELYLDPDLECALTPEERDALLGDMEWTVFTTIARVAADSGLNVVAVARRMAEMTGFDRLQDVLERHFVRRAHYLRGYRILNNARAMLDRVKFHHVPEFQQRDREQSARRDRMLAFIDAAAGDPRVAQELREMVHAGTRKSEDLIPVVHTLEGTFRDVLVELEQYNADLEALLQVEDHLDLFTEAELNELRPLLGLYGMETEKRLPATGGVDYVVDRQQYWYARQYDTRAVRRMTAERAVARYGFILDELEGGKVPT